MSTIPRIDMSPCTFDRGAIEIYGMGSGVIPISFDNEGKIQVLLGRERFVAHWKGSCRWSGFEGSRKEGETLIRTAMREFSEETMDIVAPMEEIQRRLLENDYYMRIVIKILSERKPERYHSTHVVPVVWDAHIHNRFQALRSHIEYVESLAQEWLYTRPDELAGICVGTIDVTNECATVVRKRIDRPPTPPWVVEHFDECDQTYVVVATFRGDRSLAIDAWSTLRNRLERAIARSHPCVTVTRDAHWGLIQGVEVCRDFLEKDQIRWWSVEQLQAILSGRGQTNVERFRPYFLPVLQVLVDALLSDPPTQTEPCEEPPPCAATSARSLPT